MKANIEDKGVKGDCTPLMEAANAGYVDIVQLLIANGADVNAKSTAGEANVAVFNIQLIFLPLKVVKCSIPNRMSVSLSPVLTSDAYHHTIERCLYFLEIRVYNPDLGFTLNECIKPPCLLSKFH